MSLALIHMVTELVLLDQFLTHFALQPECLLDQLLILLETGDGLLKALLLLLHLEYLILQVVVHGIHIPLLLLVLF